MSDGYGLQKLYCLCNVQNCIEVVFSQAMLIPSEVLLYTERDKLQAHSAMFDRVCVSTVARWMARISGESTRRKSVTFATQCPPTDILSPQTYTTGGSAARRRRQRIPRGALEATLQLHHPGIELGRLRLLLVDRDFTGEGKT